MLARALAVCFLQRHKPTKQEVVFYLFKCLRGYEGKCVVYTWQSRFQWDGPDSIPSYTLGDSSLHSTDGSLHKTHTHAKQILEELQKWDLTNHRMSREFNIYLLSRAARKDKKISNLVLSDTLSVTVSTPFYQTR